MVAELNRQILIRVYSEEDKKHIMDLEHHQLKILASLLNILEGMVGDIPNEFKNMDYYEREVYIFIYILHRLFNDLAHPWIKSYPRLDDWF